VTEQHAARLIIRAPGTPDVVYPLDLPVVRIGRSPAPQNDLVLTDGSVSRQHARLYCDRLPHRLQDVGSSNGTAINDLPLPVNELRPLSNGDIISIGPFRLVYSMLTEPSPASPVPEKPAADVLGSRTAKAPQPPPPAESPPTPSATPERWVGMPERSSRWLQYLPPIYAEDGFLGRFLLIFEDLAGPFEQAVSHFELYLDPETCPPDFLPLLADWLGMDLAERWPLAVKRQLVKHGAWLHRARGTVPGLRRHLEICTGGQVQIEENVVQPHTFVVHVTGATRPADVPLIESVIRQHCPAHVGYTLRID